MYIWDIKKKEKKGSCPNKSLVGCVLHKSWLFGAFLLNEIIKKNMK